MTRERLELFLDALRSERWNVATKSDDSLDLNLALLARYQSIPDAYLDFLRYVTECSNLAQTAWFLCAQDFGADGHDGSAFRWNEWERIGLEAAGGDDEITEQIATFWNGHLPILSAVHSDYAYLAISLSRTNYGAIIYGYGPEFEESATKVCGSFEEFLELFCFSVASGHLAHPAFGDFL